jgi:MscS family membrane protein
MGRRSSWQVGVAGAVLSLLLLQRAEAQSAQPEQPQGAPAEQKQPAEDPLGRSTPYGTVVGLRTAVEHENLDRAAEYLDSRLKPQDRQELARQLWVVLDRNLVASLNRVRNKPEGDPDDGLVNRDRLGSVQSPTGNVEFFLDRVQRGETPIWLFSSSTLKEIPRLYDEVHPLWIERYVPQWLKTTQWLSLPLYRWIGILLFIPLLLGVAALSTRALTALLAPVISRLTKDTDHRTVASVGPLRLLVLSLFFYVASLIGLSLSTRYFWNRVAQTLAVVALCWLSLRLVDVVAAVSLKRLQRGQRSGDVALVRLIGRLLKATTVIVAGLMLLYLSDVDLTAALTGLGVGGIAIGFGAQKTIENLFGGIMVISDKPVGVGDFCKVGEFVGTVEDIGIRSTRIRTLDRTVVSVPNGLLAAMSLENFAMRDRMRFQHIVALARQTTGDQLRYVLDHTRRLLEAHAKVDSSSARTRFVKLSGASLDIEIFAYVLENDHGAFLAIQEELLLALIDIIDASGTSLAAPIAPALVAQGR